MTLDQFEKLKKCIEDLLVNSLYCGDCNLDAQAIRKLLNEVWVMEISSNKYGINSAGQTYII